jgi:ribose 5-phosphate isomerase B
VERKTILIASDHAGFNLKKFLIEKESDLQGYSFEDLGPENSDRVDYPDFAKKLSEKISSGDYEKGVLICGSGIGMSITANRYPKVRAALVETVKSAELSRQHNDSNVLCMGERIISSELALDILKKWLSTSFEGGRHTDRVKKIELDYKV